MDGLERSLEIWGREVGAGRQLEGLWVSIGGSGVRRVVTVEKWGEAGLPVLALCTHLSWVTANSGKGDST